MWTYIGSDEKFQGVSIREGRVESVELFSGARVKPKAVFSQTSYSRQSGKDKVLTRVLDRAMVNLPPYLTSFDAIFAVDTNTKRIGNDSVSIACVRECRAQFSSATTVTVDFSRYVILPFKNCRAGHEEKRSWSKVVAMACASPDYKESLKFAILTDHDLRNHDRYQSRELPIYREVYLPPNFELIFVTSDAGANGVNQLLKVCDADAGRVLRDLEKTGRAAVDSRSIILDRIPDVRAEQ